MVCYYSSDLKKEKKKLEKTQNNDLFISPTNKSQKMDFFGEKAILEELNEPSHIKVHGLAHLCP